MRPQPKTRQKSVFKNKSSKLHSDSRNARVGHSHPSVVLYVVEENQNSEEHKNASASSSSTKAPNLQVKPLSSHDEPTLLEAASAATGTSTSYPSNKFFLLDSPSNHHVDVYAPPSFTASFVEPLGRLRAVVEQLAEAEPGLANLVRWAEWRKNTLLAGLQELRLPTQARRFSY